jgi:hypothetical protein
VEHGAAAGRTVEHGTAPGRTVEHGTATIHFLMLRYNLISSSLGLGSFALRNLCFKGSDSALVNHFTLHLGQLGAKAMRVRRHARGILGMLSFPMSNIFRACAEFGSQVLHPCFVVVG